MTSKSASVVLTSPKSEVFSFVSKVENLLKWAMNFAKDLKKENGEYKIVTPAGEMIFAIDGDEKGGAIDMFAGPSREQMSMLPPGLWRLGKTLVPSSLQCFRRLARVMKSSKENLHQCWKSSTI